MKISASKTTQDPAQCLDFLLCDGAGGFRELPQARSPSGCEWVASPIRCLDKAVDGDHGIIVVRFGRTSIPERETLVELAAALKRNSHTRGRPVLALLPERHRKLLEDLHQAGVDFVAYLDEGPLDSFRLRETVRKLGLENRLDRQLAKICPFLHYSRLDALNEMEVCGAYLDRMVLGGFRLHEVCQTGVHLGCECYLHPRRKA